MSLTLQNQIPVTFTCNEVVVTSTIKAEYWTSRRAFRLGMKWCGAAWLGALITLPVPLLHFVAVPACLLAGPPLGYVMYRFYRGSTEIISGNGKCPACQYEWELVKKTVDWPRLMNCPKCNAELMMEPTRHS